MTEVVDILRLIEEKNYEAIKEHSEEQHPAEIAEQLSRLEPDVVWETLLCIQPDIRAEIFSHIPLELQIDISDTLSRKDLAQIFSDMSPDDRVDLFKKLSDETQELLLPALAQAERDDILRLSSYPEGTVGSAMTSDYVSLLAAQTVAEALVKLRLQAPNKETIYYSYVVDEKRTLLGFVSLKDLILSKPEIKIENIMQAEPVFSYAMDDQEDAARKIQKYDMLAIPVVDQNNGLVGILTHDDALDIIVQEQTEDLEKLMAITGSHEAGAYLSKSAFRHFRDRAPWVVALAIVGLISGTIIHAFEETLMALMIIAMYMPMIVDAGGNTGSQAATVIIRALALKEISTKDYFKVVFKELRIALLLSMVLGLVTFGRVMFLSQGANIPEQYTLPLIGVAIAVGLAIQVVSATLIGSLLPLIATRLKFDPAVVASPALTTFVDITGLLIYFTSVTVILGL